MHQWKRDGHILRATIDGIDFEIYLSTPDPGIYRLRCKGKLISETFSEQEAQRWAEMYHVWLDQELPNMPARRKGLPPLTDMSNFWELAGLTQFPRYPDKFHYRVDDDESWENDFQKTNEDCLKLLSSINEKLKSEVLSDFQADLVEHLKKIEKLLNQLTEKNTNVH